MSRRFLLILGILLASFLFAISVLPTEVKHSLHTQGALHPWLHLVGFAVLACTLLSASRSDFARALLILGLLLFGYATEWNESHRNGWAVEVKDVRSDSIGVLCGSVAGLLLASRRRA